MLPTSAISLQGLVHRYGDRVALRDLTLEIAGGEMFALLGPNGGGKTTLFRVLATLLPLQAGRVRIMGHDVHTQPNEVRRRIGVVFQSPSLDKKLTVEENLWQQAMLYGMHRIAYRSRCDELLNQLGIADRRRDLTETLSGGLKRRVELAKGLLHRPELLLMDEPSTGLDPGARSDLWRSVAQLRAESPMTVLFTSHLLEEAEPSDRIGILHRGDLVALGTSAALRASLGGDVIQIETAQPAQVCQQIVSEFGLKAQSLEGQVRIDVPDGADWVPRLSTALGTRFQAIRVGRPTLEDVFIARTGHQFFAATKEHG